VIAIRLAVALAAPAGAFTTTPVVNLKQWGAITTPVFGTSEKGCYARAELFAGPKPTAPQQVADNDVALGIVVQHIMQSPVYYNRKSGEGSAIFITEDDAQSSVDHIHPHRTPLVVVSPYARPGYAGKRHYSTASIVKTEELLLGLPPMNLGDLLATDLRDLFQPWYNGITAENVPFIQGITYVSTPAGRKIFDLSKQLDIYDGPDDDSFRTGAIGRLSIYADQLYFANADKEAQDDVYEEALKLINTQVGDQD
jgi:hypothetical protein